MKDLVVSHHRMIEAHGFREGARGWLNITVEGDRVLFRSRSARGSQHSVTLNMGLNDLWELLHQLEVERGEA